MLIGGPQQRRVVQSVNAAAAALGLRAGQTLTTARALADGFTCVEADPARIEQLQQLLATWAYRFSGQVSRHYPRALLLEVGSSLGLFGPWPAFEARLRLELDELGLRHRIVLATNPVAARVLANGHDGLAVMTVEDTRAALACMPVDKIGLPRRRRRRSPAWGCAISVKSWPCHAMRWPGALPPRCRCTDQLLGLRSLGLAYHQPAERFEVRLELNFDVESHQALLFPLRRLLSDLAVFLAGRDCGVQRFHLYGTCPGPATELKVGLLAAERDAARLFELARGRLESLRIPAPVRNLRLLAEDLPPFVPQHQALFDPRAQQAQPWEQLRERLRARLGDDAVKALSAEADHRPECAWQPVEQGPWAYCRSRQAAALAGCYLSPSL